MLQIVQIAFLCSFLPLPLPTSARPSSPSQPLRPPKNCADAQPGCTCIDITFSRPNWTVTDMKFHAPEPQLSSPTGHGPEAQQQPPPPGSGAGKNKASKSTTQPPADPAAVLPPPPLPPLLGGGNLSFSLRNPAAGYQTACAADTAGSIPKGGDAGPFDDNDAVFACDAAAAPADRPGRAWFRFDLRTRRIAINQTWTCREGGEILQFFAQGNATIPQLCSHTGAVAHSSDRRAGEHCRNSSSFEVPWLVIEGQ